MVFSAKRLSQVCLSAATIFFCSAYPLAAAQEAAEPAQGLGVYKLINTAIFAVLVAWAIWKYAPTFFNARSADIQKAIKDATGLKIEADFRYSDADKRMANLSGEVERLRAESKAAMDREHARLEQQTREEIEKIAKNKENEVAALRDEAADRVRLHTARLALGLAEKRLQDQLEQGASDGSLGVDDFVRLVKSERPA